MFNLQPLPQLLVFILRPQLLQISVLVRQASYMVRPFYQLHQETLRQPRHMQICLSLGGSNKHVHLAPRKVQLRLEWLLHRRG
jgi:hypothetical protein